MGRLAPLSEEPTNEEDDSSNGSKKGMRQTWRNWIKTHISLVFNKRSDLKILLSVLGCPLFPLSLHPDHSLNEVSSSAQYIIQHFTAATGCRKLEGTVKNIFVTGKVTMAMGDHDLGSAGVSASGAASSSSSTSSTFSQKGCFVMWQMVPNKWLIELVVGGHKVIAGSDGNVAWRHTPWLSAHAAKGGVRPLRRALQASNSYPIGIMLPLLRNAKQKHLIRMLRKKLCLNHVCVHYFPCYYVVNGSKLSCNLYEQGLDPLAISAVFSPAQFIGEKRISGEDCFMLKLSADQTDLAERSDSTAEMIKHVIFGYFSQRSGLLVFLEDSYLTRIQSPGTYPTYWETTMSTKIEDYRTVEGVMIAHSGQTNVIITRFGDNLKSGPAITRMEEIWTIDDIAFNVPGLSIDCFIAPNDVQKHYLPDDNLDWRKSL
ncbi:hypothetical protein F8388_013357 [Cannabis sativa]|uniref:Lipase n=1 Tax=Cannabis sativa TaxID=3483 RepID=A0A7J6FEG8_CANSA|nr:hypothetical protein F8388_013357 [Cannabis sativa]